MKKILLSKSKIKEMLKCEQMFFSSVNNLHKQNLSKQDIELFEQGRQVEQVARNMFPTGVLQDKIVNIEKIELTKELMKTKEVIFEAAFTSKNTIIQFDILSKNEDSSYDAIEIKSSSKFKPDYEIDVLIQYWIATLSGIKINQFEIWYINKTSIGIDDNYFTKHNATEFCKTNEQYFWELLNKALSIAMLRQPPQETNKYHKCDIPSCPYRQQSIDKLSTKDSVLSLPRFPNAWKAIEQGIESVNHPKFDETYKYSELNPLVIKSIREDKLVIDRENLMKEYSQWKFPLSFFDFETLMTAIPILEGQHPFEQVAFQFSNHIYTGNSNKLSHTMFLHQKLNNPNVEIVEAILSALEQNEGSIVAYNKSFEQTRIRELAAKFPQYQIRLLAIIDRFVDLMDLVKDNVYHPDFMGSYSLKIVSPTLLKEFGSYSDSLIKSGSEIAKYYTEMLTTSDMERKDLIKNALEKYCFYDTLNLFLVLQFLINPNADIKNLVEINLGLKNE